jgi:site-specific DNA-methyltransferase (adenine-specific)
VIHHGDCLDVMAAMEPESIASVVTDPPYDLLTTSRNGSRRINNPDTPAGRTARGFMGKTWDGTGIAFRPETWALALAVAKPGAHLLAFGGTRTVHRMTVAIEDAGWDIRDCLVWGYASGFPKSHNLDGEWDGWGTALKPAWEPIVMARKPLRATVAVNVALHGTGALNIDDARIGLGGGTAGAGAGAGAVVFADGLNGTRAVPVPGLGRWPANVILTDPIFDGDVEGVVGGGYTESGEAHVLRRGGTTGLGMGFGSSAAGDVTDATYGDSGTYSRFFLIPKADRAEREPVGLRGFDQSREMAHCRTGDMDTPYLRGETLRRNVHPTVKPVDLMRHLIRLVTPPSGTVLDPFLGSGTTGLACEMEGFPWIGIEKEAEYVAIAEARLFGVQKGMGLVG